jgi:hypothetical protein
MAREYAVTFEKVSVSAVQDLFQIIGAAGKILRIIRIAVSCVDATLPAAECFALRCRYLPATVTNGSGGSSPTPRPLDPGDAAASFTAKANSTTQATTSGTAITLEENGCHAYAGFDYQFPYPPIVGPSESFTFELITTPSATTTLSGTCIVEELGG